MINKEQKRKILKKKFHGKGGPGVGVIPFDNKGQRDSWMAKNGPAIANKANGKTAGDALRNFNPILAAGRVLKGVDDSFVDPAISRFKNIMGKISNRFKRK
jgi:hypothetical protein